VFVRVVAPGLNPCTRTTPARSPTFFLRPQRLSSRQAHHGLTPTPHHSDSPLLHLPHNQPAILPQHALLRYRQPQTAAPRTRPGLSPALRATTPPAPCGRGCGPVPDRAECGEGGGEDLQSPGAEHRGAGWGGGGAIVGSPPPFSGRCRTALPKSSFVFLPELPSLNCGSWHFKSIGMTPTL
jgi:hypothetical protein